MLLSSVSMVHRSNVSQLAQLQILSNLVISLLFNAFRWLKRYCVQSIFPAYRHGHLCASSLLIAIVVGTLCSILGTCSTRFFELYHSSARSWGHGQMPSVSSRCRSSEQRPVWECPEASWFLVLLASFPPSSLSVLGKAGCPLSTALIALTSLPSTSLHLYRLLASSLQYLRYKDLVWLRIFYLDLVTEQSPQHI